VAAAAPRADTVKAVEAKRAGAASADGVPNLQAVDSSILKDAFLSEVRKAKKYFFGTVVAQAQRIEFRGDAVVFTFAPQHRALRAQLEQTRAWLEAAASQLAGRAVSIAAAEGFADATSDPPASADARPAAAAAVAPPPKEPDRARTLKERALSDPGVQTMLDVFAAEIKDVEEREA
jgi:hypothetical protein